MNLDRARGLMIGVAVGDCLGHAVEGHRTVPEAYIDEVLAGPRHLVYSDDTVMTMAVAESLLERGDFDGEHMAMRFATDFRDEPYRGYGGGIRRYFERVLAGRPYDAVARSQFDGGGSYGNGAAMRVAPVALLAQSWDETVALARATAMVTHTHPVGVDGAVVQAMAVRYAFEGGTELGELTELILREVTTDEFKAKLDLVPRALERDDIDYARLHLGNWVAADDSVVSALWCYQRSSSFEETILSAIRLGGDTDTIAAMAGAIAGARYGYEAIPEGWRKVEAADRLLDLADRMWDARRGS